MRDQEDLTAADPDLVFTASKFVKNILEKAKIEAAKRLKAQNLVSTFKWISFKKNPIMYTNYTYSFQKLKHNADVEGNFLYVIKVRLDPDIV